MPGAELGHDVPSSSVPVVTHGDWIGVQAGWEFWCLVEERAGRRCAARYTCQDTASRCELLPAWVVDSFARRHADLIKVVAKCPMSAHRRRTGVPDLVLWRWRGARAARLVEVKTPQDVVRPHQEACLRTFLARMTSKGKLAVVDLPMDTTSSSRGLTTMYNNGGHARRARLPPVRLNKAQVAELGTPRPQGRRGPLHLGGMRGMGLARDAKGAWWARTEFAALVHYVATPPPTGVTVAYMG